MNQKKREWRRESRRRGSGSRVA